MKKGIYHVTVLSHDKEVVVVEAVIIAMRKAICHAIVLSQDKVVAAEDVEEPLVVVSTISYKLNKGL